MSTHSHVKVWIHLVWGTLDHEHILNKKLRIDLFQHIVSYSQKNEVFIGKLNIQPEHVHVLLSLPVEKTVSQIAKNLKGESSHWINENNLIPGKFRWQRGYGAYSISASQLNTVKNYIENQNEHHQKNSFSEEFEEWARRYGVWDE